jgi:hypothetical protein
MSERELRQALTNLLAQTMPCFPDRPMPESLCRAVEAARVALATGGPDHSHPLFTCWNDDHLKSLARIVDSAAGEGVADNEFADAIRDEARRRGIALPAAYGLGESGPDAWRKDLDR